MTNPKTFNHDNKDFEIRTAIMGNRYCVRVYLNNIQVSPEYSATLEVGQDFFSQHRESLINQLTKIAEDDIRKGIYFST
jgi:hypothetical protein